MSARHSPAGLAQLAGLPSPEIVRGWFWGNFAAAGTDLGKLVDLCTARSPLTVINVGAMLYGKARSRRAARWARIGLVLGLWVGGVETAQAQSTKDDLARTHFESGAAYLQQSDLEGALREFESAYQLSPRPEILLNIATVYERMAKWPEAVKALERYLADAPDGEHAGTVQLRIDNLKKRIDDASKEKPATESPPVAKKPAEPSNADTAPAPAPAEPPSAATAVPAEPEPAASRRLPAYLLLGGAGLAAVGATVTGLLANSEYDDLKGSCSPNCTDDEVSKSKTLALTSTILTAVAVVAGGLGATLFFTEPATLESANARQLRIFVGVDRQGLEGRASWRF